MTTKINKNVYIRNNIIYVQGGIDGTFHRVSTGKEPSTINVGWAKKNYKQVLLQHIDKKKQAQKNT